ncbi:MAG: heavy metal translocating P-type ATPase [Vicinamibacterales bacterium]
MPNKPVACAVCEIHAESVFKIEGMDCREEVAILERRLKPLPGLEDIVPDLVGQRLRVRYDAARLSTAAIVEAVAQTGMRAWLEHEEPVGHSKAATSRQALVVASGAALAAGLLFEFRDLPLLLVRGTYLISILTGGIYTARRAWAATRVMSLDINVLMLVAVVGAMLIGEWSEGATVTFLFAFAQILEARSMDRARHAIRALMDLTPPIAVVRRAGHEARVPVDDVAVAEVLLVKPGEKIPLDGVVVAGTSPVNQAPITGESLPVEKSAGDDVFAGTINGHGALDIRVTHLRQDTTLARIIALVELAQSQRAPSQAFVERFARYYTPAVIALAIGVSVVPPFVLGQPFEAWFYRALVLLVISCPCALVISTPISVVSAIATAARRGVLIKGGVHLERIGSIQCVAFDKTGTLTKGVPHVVDVIPLNDTAIDEILEIAAGLEARSEHPVGRAILARAVESGIARPLSMEFQSIPGRGAEAVVAGYPALIGNHRLIEERGLCNAAIHSTLDALAASGRTAVLVARQGRPLGIIALADRTRESARDAIEMLRRQGVKRVVMLTGDNQASADALAREIGVDETYAELLPHDKVAVVHELKKKYGIVAMVGDGVNDAPALAAADVGIAMGAVGTDAALETADIALMADELLKLPFAIRLGRATLRNIQVNVTLSLGLKAVFLALAVAGSATLWMAVMADMGASLLVIANGMRLLRAD